MSDIKCPFCGQKLESFYVESRPVFACCNLNCKGYFMNAPKELWEALIQTKQDLEIAIKGIKTLGEYDPYKEHLGIDTIAQNILEQIERKENQ